MPKKDVLTIALPKGRLLKEAVEIFERAGIDAKTVLKDDRRPIFDNPKTWTHVRVATKYPNITTSFFLEKGVQVEIIKLYGSIELAPLLGLCERIVDLVQTGETLRSNGLSEVETIMDVTSRLVCNRASLKTKPKRLKTLIEALRKTVAKRK